MMANDFHAYANALAIVFFVDLEAGLFHCAATLQPPDGAPAFVRRIASPRLSRRQLMRKPECPREEIYRWMG